MAGYQEHQNYLRIKEHIHMVETMQLTEDRLEQFKGHVEFIRMFFTNISKLNPEIKDPEFRNMANCAEIYMMELEKEFNLRYYHSFLIAFQYLTDRTMQEEELSELLATMSVN